LFQFLISQRPSLRIDLFLKLTGLTKTRMTAKRLCEDQKVLLGGLPVKPSHEVTGGEEIRILFPQKEVKARVLGIPPGKSLAKRNRHEFLSVETKEVF
jgi:ribosomal 50S subunit-recycling heat shock protein